LAIAAVIKCVGDPSGTREVRVEYHVGQLVRNKKFGVGKVLEINGSSVTVFFKTWKTILARSM
jgi:hypothetical protein